MPRRPEQFKELRKKSSEKILDAALELFGRNGYESTSIESIAKKAGISKGLVYNYYDSKKNILLAIFDNVMAQGEKIMGMLQDEKDPYIRVQGLLHEFFKMIKDNPEYFKLLMVLSLQPSVLEDMKEYRDDMFNKSQEYTRQIFGKINGNDKYKTFMMDALMDGIMINYLRYGDKYPMAAMEKKIIEEYCTPPKGYVTKGTKKKEIKKKLNH